jgi:hypothetical protein
MLTDITLQINLSPGDVNYADLTVPALVSQHEDIKNRLLVVDCCRPQKSKLVNPDIKFPVEKFNTNVKKIIAICQRLLQQNIVSDVYLIKPDDPLIDAMSKKYLNGLYKTTHSAGGTANMAYWLGLDLPDTRYVIHYDADILLWQKPGFSWAKETIKYMAENDNVVMGVPRFCPPIAGNTNLQSLHEGRPSTDHLNYWTNDWFSTRCFLVDKQKIARYLPFVQGKLKLELLARRYGKRAFPLDPEIVMFKSMAPRGAMRLMLKSDNAWITHPANKSEQFVDNLGKFLTIISQGHFPEVQRGIEDVDMDGWLDYLKVPN